MSNRAGPEASSAAPPDLNMLPMKPVPWAVRPVLALVAALAAPSAASAAGHVCQRVADQTMSPDGMLDDWRGFRTRRVGSGADHSMKVRCAYDARNLYVALDVADDRVIRLGRGDRSREDSVSVRLGVPGSRAVKLRAFPGTRGFEPMVKGAPRWAAVADSLQPRGFSVEIGVPLGRIPGWTRTLPAISADIRFTDVDSSKKVEGGARLRGRLHFSETFAVFKSFLQATGLSMGQLHLDTLADVDLGRGAERIVAGGDVIGVLSDSFVYMKLPVASPSDVLKVKVVNFSGTGRAQLLAHYRQHGNGSRELVGVWSLGEGDRFEKLLALEVKKKLGESVIENSWSLVRTGEVRKQIRGRQRPRGRWALLVEPGTAVGFDESSYHEMPPTDAKPIRLPWRDGAAVYWFDGDQLGGSAELPKAKERKRRRRR